MASTAGARDFVEVRLGARCEVQTPENRFGSGILDDLKTFVYSPPEAFLMDDVDDDVDDDSSSGEDDADSEASGPAAEEEATFFDINDTSALPTASEHPNPQQGPPAPQPGFPRLQRVRCNLTALSQRYNLYFAAYADKIYVYQPRMSSRILPGPSVILTPRKTRAAKMIGGIIDRTFPHQMNSILVGQLGDLEIVCFAFDDGDVGAYYTHTIAQCITAHSGNDQATGGSASRNAAPKQFFHDNVGLSAWGLAVHQQSRLVAVSSNRAEVTVFAFATTDNPCQDVQAEPDTSPPLLDGTTAWELEKHFQSRTRTWRIVLSTGPRARNMPSIAFADDETGYAEKVVAYDVGGRTWIMDIWTLGALPIQLPPLKPPSGWNQLHPRPVGWGILVLPDSSFMQVETASAVLGVPEAEAIPVNLLHDTSTSALNSWVDTTCSLYYVRDLAPNADSLLQRYQNSTARYPKVHADASKPSIERHGLSRLPPGDWDDDSDQSPGEAEEEGAEDSHQNADSSAEQRWKRLGPSHGHPHPGLRNSNFSDLSEPVQLSRAIVPRSGMTTPLTGTADQLISLTSNSEARNYHTTPIEFADATFSPYAAQNLTLFRALSTDFELQPFDRRSAGIVCRSVLTHHSHQGRRNEPWDLRVAYSERISMLVHVPELNLVVAGALNGRVALLTLTKAASASARARGVRISRAFRVDWVLPRRSDEERKLRPWCTLHGIAVSPVPDPKARGLDLHGRRGRAPHSHFRLLLHYVNHTILMYDISRSAESDDLMIF